MQRRVGGKRCPAVTIIRRVDLLMDEGPAVAGIYEFAREHILNELAIFFLPGGHIRCADLDTQRFELIAQGGFPGFFHGAIVTQEL